MAEERDVGQCEALVGGPTWLRADPTGQCGREGLRRELLAGAYLCWQHEQKAEGSGELELADGRTLVLEQEWSEDSWRKTLVSARIVANVTHLGRAKQERPGR